LTVEEDSLYNKLKEQAKEMEKQQIEAAWKRGDGEHDKVANELSEKYYIETYGT
jgi:transcriptional regulator with PAS, ATPase and Fis domain